ncbi:MAG: hypothetical protein JWO44_2283 [Bacteroidetes bacterium]|nr:hypothetical protein [Bacteroidota bacterium]
MKIKILDNQYFETIAPSVVNDILESCSYNKDLIFSKYKYAEALKYYLILTYGKGKIPAVSKEILYTNRYYWLKLFYHYYSRECGKDAGIEQQIGTLIEEMANTFDDYDWNELEHISNAISNIP